MSAGGIFAQDKIILQKGEEINVKIVKIDSSEVHYKKANDPTFTTQVLDELQINKVIFEDGKVLKSDQYFKPNIIIIFTII